MKFKTEWSEIEVNAVVRAFATWEKNNLVVTYGRRERKAIETYGLPYTSTSDYAMVSNTNCEAELKEDRSFKFDHIAINSHDEIVVVCMDDSETEKYIIIG